MYRELASLQTFGVPGGPYTGAPQRFLVRELPLAVRERLVRTLRGEALPSPLMAVSASARRSSTSMFVCLSLAALPIVVWFCLAPRIPGPWVGLSFFAWYATIGLVVERLARRETLPQGLYLFPLDIVQIDATHLTVTPLGSLRRVGLERGEAAGQIALVLQFEHGARFEFSCWDEPTAEGAYQKMVEAQEALERITFNGDLQETTDLDPFFAIRNTQEWSSPGLRVTEARRSVIAAAIGGLTGIVVLFGCSAHADRRMFEYAERAGTKEAYRRYVEAGGRVHRIEAERRIVELYRAAARERGDSMLEPDDQEASWANPFRWRHRADFELEPEAAKQRSEAQQQALAAYSTLLAEDRGWKTTFPAISSFEAVFRTARERGEDHAYLHFEHTFVPWSSSEALLPQQRFPCCGEHECETNECPSVQETLEKILVGQEDVLARAFSRIVSENLPASVLTFERLERAPTPDDPLVFRVRTHVRYRSVASMQVEFDFVPWSLGAPVPGEFHLLMPPSKTPLLAPRSRSLFVVSRGERAERQAELAFARAHDRLYDELYGVLFPGDPRVPIAEDEMQNTVPRTREDQP